MITGPAIRTDDGNLYSLSRPARHHDVIRVMVEEHGIEPPVVGLQGFITSRGDFLTREQAAGYALAAGQISQINQLPTGWQLYTEDLW